MRFLSHSDKVKSSSEAARPVTFESTVTLDSKSVPGVRFTILRMSFGRRMELFRQIREIAPQADLATRTRRVRITLMDPPLSFRLGSIVKAIAATDARAEIELPSPALLERHGQTFVWVVDAATSKVSMREVKIGARDTDSFRVAEGLAPGTRVVTAGVHSLSAGQAVKLPETN